MISFLEEGEQLVKAGTTDCLKTVRMDVTSDESVTAAFKHIKSSLPPSVGMNNNWFWPIENWKCGHFLWFLCPDKELNFHHILSKIKHTTCNNMHSWPVEQTSCFRLKIQKVLHNKSNSMSFPKLVLFEWSCHVLQAYTLKSKLLCKIWFCTLYGPYDRPSHLPKCQP